MLLTLSILGMYLESKSRSRVDESGIGLGTSGIRATAGDEESVDYGGEIHNTGKMLSYLLAHISIFLLKICSLCWILGFPPVSSIIDSVASEDQDEGKYQQQHFSNEVVQPMEAPRISYSGLSFLFFHYIPSYCFCCAKFNLEPFHAMIGDEVSSTREESMSSTCENAASSVTLDRYSNGGVDVDGIRAPLPTVR